MLHFFLSASYDWVMSNRDLDWRTSVVYTTLFSRRLAITSGLVIFALQKYSWHFPLSVPSFLFLRCEKYLSWLPFTFSQFSNKLPSQGQKIPFLSGNTLYNDLCIAYTPKIRRQPVFTLSASRFINVNHVLILFSPLSSICLSITKQVRDEQRCVLAEIGWGRGLEGFIGNL